MEVTTYQSVVVDTVCKKFTQLTQNYKPRTNHDETRGPVLDCSKCGLVHRSHVCPGENVLNVMGKYHFQKICRSKEDKRLQFKTGIRLHIN